MLTASQKVVTPVKTGVQWFYIYLNLLDSDFRRNDDLLANQIFSYFINARPGHGDLLCRLAKI